MSNFRAGDRVTMTDKFTGAEHGGTVVRRLNSLWVRVIWDVTSTISTERESILKVMTDKPTRGKVIL